MRHVSSMRRKQLHILKHHTVDKNNASKQQNRKDIKQRKRKPQTGLLNTEKRNANNPPKHLSENYSQQNKKPSYIPFTTINHSTFLMHQEKQIRWNTNTRVRIET